MIIIVITNNSNNREVIKALEVKTKARPRLLDSRHQGKTKTSKFKPKTKTKALTKNIKTERDRYTL